LPLGAIHHEYFRYDRMFNQKQIKSLEDTATQLEINPALIGECVEKYNDLPYTRSEELLTELKRTSPQLLAANLTKRDDLLEHDLLAQHAELIANLNTESDVQKYLAEAASDLEELESKLKNTLKFHNVRITTRTKSPSSILQNISRGNDYTLTDVIGVRIIPDTNSDMKMIADQLEQVLKQHDGFKLNILAYSRQRASDRISPSSVHYKAIHYYSPTTHYNSEIQLRGVYTDIWADLNHMLVYKPTIEADPRVVQLLSGFGEMSNVVDFYEFCS